ncbi:MAG: hypothetical protein NW215_10580 [Hyphomicrobiales bacterium]|nr:hypothetical protein [Hyphomicrobiales bacterium]
MRVTLSVLALIIGGLFSAVFLYAKAYWSVVLALGASVIAFRGMRSLPIRIAAPSYLFALFLAVVIFPAQYVAETGPPQSSPGAPAPAQSPAAEASQSTPSSGYALIVQPGGPMASRVLLNATARTVKRADYPDAWPMRSDEAVIVCHQELRGAFVVFIVGGAAYALNGATREEAFRRRLEVKTPSRTILPVLDPFHHAEWLAARKPAGWPKSEPWNTRINIDPLFKEWRKMNCYND